MTCFQEILEGGRNDVLRKGEDPGMTDEPQSLEFPAPRSARGSEARTPRDGASDTRSSEPAICRTRRALMLWVTLGVVLGGCGGSPATTDRAAEISAPVGPVADHPPSTAAASAAPSAPTPPSAPAARREVRGAAPQGDPTPIAAALRASVGKSVVVQGNLVERCPSEGCWFVVEDGGSRVTVDVEEAGFRVLDVPLGTSLRVGGKTVRRGPRTLVVGTGVVVHP